MTPLALSVFLSVAAPGPLDVNGLWYTVGGGAIVEVADCGDGTPCGTIRWVNPTSLAPGERADSLVDADNPDPALRERPIIGLPLLQGFEKAKGKWRKGEIYDPEEGKTYRSAIKRSDDGTLAVQGCVGPVCKTQRWQPAPTIPTP